MRINERKEYSQDDTEENRRELVKMMVSLYHKSGYKFDMEWQGVFGQGRTALHVAIEEGELEIVKCLIE